MKCVDPDCGGEVDPIVHIVLQTGCHSTSCAYPCTKCDRLHFSHGTGVMTRDDPGRPVYLKDGKPWAKNPDGTFEERPR